MKLGEYRDDVVHRVTVELAVAYLLPGCFLLLACKTNWLLCVNCRIPGCYANASSARLGRTSSKEQYAYLYRYCNLYK